MCYTLNCNEKYTFEKSLKKTEALFTLNKEKARKSQNRLESLEHTLLKVSARNSFNFVKNKEEGEIVPWSRVYTTFAKLFESLKTNLPQEEGPKLKYLMDCHVKLWSKIYMTDFHLYFVKQEHNFFLLFYCALLGRVHNTVLHGVASRRRAAMCAAAMY